MNTPSKCPIQRIQCILSPFIGLIRGVARRVSDVIPESPAYTFRYGAQHLWLVSLRKDFNIWTQWLDIDTIYDDIVENGADILRKLSSAERGALERYCESEVSIWVTRQLLWKWKNIKIWLPENSDILSLRDILQHLFSAINTELYSIAIDYIAWLKWECGNENLSREVKILRISRAFWELEWAKWLPEEMKKLIFISWISTTLTNIIEMVWLKMKTISWFDRELLWSLINENQGYWNDVAKSNIPMEYIMQWLWYRKAGDFRTKTWGSKSVQGREYLYDFEAWSMGIQYLFSQSDFRKFVRMGRKTIQEKWPNTYVGCPLLYEVDDESQSNMIIALQNMMLSKVLEGLWEYYETHENK